MSQIAGFINNKIVSFTGNESTKSFIGRAVEPKKSNGKPVYLIDGTGYVLTPAEFQMFVREGLIDSPIRERKETKVDIFGNSEEFYETSEFFKGRVQFQMDIPKHERIADAFSERMTGFFDKVGFNAKEKIVASLND